MTIQEVAIRMKYGILLTADLSQLSVSDLPLDLVKCLVKDNFNKLRREAKQRQGRK